MSGWKQRPEGSGRRLMAAYLWLAIKFGRRAASILLTPITLYFLVFRGPERRESRRFLARALARPAGAGEVYHHFRTFAQVVLDRVYLLGTNASSLCIDAEGLEALDRALAMNRGCILLGSHLGSFEASRIVSLGRPEVPLRILMDRGQNPNSTALLEALNPPLARQVIDVGGGAPEAMLALQSALDAGGLVAVLGDRAVADERTAPVQFLDATARLPISPYLLAAICGAPVVLFFGLYVGGGRYRVVFEPFADRLDLPRGRRQAVAAEWAQRYADRLAHHALANPYNWFNFYPFWESSP